MRSAAATLRILPAQWLEPVHFAGFFDHPERPLEIDLGCGKGRFLLARAATFPDINFLGIDRMLERIRKVDKKALQRGLRNIRLFRMEAYYAVTYLIPPRSVDACYIFYPDPWPKTKHREHRLFSPPFMDALARTLKPGGKVHASTDHLPYFEMMHALLQRDSRFEETEPFVPAPDETTDFELIFAHKTPGRCSFVRKEG